MTDMGEVVAGLEDGTRLSMTLSLPVSCHVSTHVHRHEPCHVIPRVDAGSRKNNRIMWRMTVWMTDVAVSVDALDSASKRGPGKMVRVPDGCETY